MIDEQLRTEALDMLGMTYDMPELQDQALAQVERIAGSRLAWEVPRYLTTEQLITANALFADGMTAEGALTWLAATVPGCHELIRSIVLGVAAEAAGAVGHG